MLLVCVIAIGAISCNSNSYLIICSLYCVLPMISTIWKYTGRKIMESGYDVICAFSGLGLLPFALDSVGNSKDTGKTVSFAVFTLGILLYFCTELLLPSVFGWGRAEI